MGLILPITCHKSLNIRGSDIRAHTLSKVSSPGTVMDGGCILCKKYWLPVYEYYIGIFWFAMSEYQVSNILNNFSIRLSYLNIIIDYFDCSLFKYWVFEYWKNPIRIYGGGGGGRFATLEKKSWTFFFRRDRTKPLINPRKLLISAICMNFSGFVDQKWRHSEIFCQGQCQKHEIGGQWFVL